MFKSDHPIVKSSEDKLNRATFAKYLARCMLDHKDPDSLVVGLYGGLGVGKTSVINMVVEELNFAASNLDDAEKPIILNFNVWSYSGQHQLIYSFFRRLSAILYDVPFLENRDRIIHLLEIYVSFFTHKPVPKAFRTKRTLKSRLRLGFRQDLYGWESGRDLSLVKAELNELLLKQKHKIIIIIDNISHLYAEEIKQIFQIVKSMGDYVNTVYLLAFDKNHVVDLLNRLDGSDGEALVQKVVQLPFTIPAISPQDLESIFADRLQSILTLVPEGSWNTEYWSDLYYNVLRFLFTNIRDITRYANMLYFSYPRLKEVVNPVDFFALTAVEVFMPNLYLGIRDNKDLFSDLLANVYALDHDQIQKDKLRCEEILARDSVLPHHAKLELLMLLFPRIRKIYQPQQTFYYSETIANNTLRLSSLDAFDSYFRLSLQVNQLPNTEFETLLKVASDKVEFDHALVRLNQDDKITKFLDKLDSKAIHNLQVSNIKNIIIALMDNGDLFPQGSVNMLSLDTPTHIHRIVNLLLIRIKSQEERFEILKTAIMSATKSLYIFIHELQEQSREHREESDAYLPLEYRLLSPEQLSALKEAASKKINEWAANGSLATHPRLLLICEAWIDFGHKEACTYFIKTMTDTDPGLVQFLVNALERPIHDAMNDYEKKRAWVHSLARINDIIPATSLAAHAKGIFEDPFFEKLNEKEQLAILIFLDMLKVKTRKIIPKTVS